MIDDLAMAETGETADDQARICRPQPLDGLFHVPFFFSVPTGDLCIGRFENCDIYCKANSYITAASTPKEVTYGYIFNN